MCDLLSEISETKNWLLGETFEMSVNWTLKLLFTLTLQPKKSNEVYILTEKICYNIETIDKRENQKV